jgi:hypothetical protein
MQLEDAHQKLADIMLTKQVEQEMEEVEPQAPSPQKQRIEVIIKALSSRCDFYRRAIQTLEKICSSERVSSAEMEDFFLTSHDAREKYNKYPHIEQAGNMHQVSPLYTASP